MKSNVLYYFLMILSIVCFVLVLLSLAETKLLGPVLLIFSIYFFLGSLIKLCKNSDKLRNSFVCIIDFLFWLP